jgi:DNA-binding transcriptional LysR family regulator
MYQNAKQFLESEQELFFSKTHVPQRELRIGSVEIFNGVLIAGLRDYSIHLDNLKIIDIEPGLMEQQILSKNLDFGITYLPFPQNNLRLIPMGKFKLGCFHREGVFQDIAMQEPPFVVPSKLLAENPLGIKERDGWHDSLFPRKISFRANLLSTAMDLVLEGCCAIVIPHFVAKLVNKAHRNSGRKLVERPMPAMLPNPQQTAYVMCHDQYVEDQKLREVCKIIRMGIRHANV